MNTKLREMNLDKPQPLFPIFLVKHKDEWANWYNEECKNLMSLIPNKSIKRISHIGSTAVPSIWTKNIIDILLEVENEKDLLIIKDMLQEHNWLYMSDDKNRISLKKGYTNSGFADKVFHLHIRIAGDNNELYFRDYLRDNPDIAKLYEKLKIRLWQQYEYDREGYTNAKSNFITQYTEKAKIEYKGRYEK